MIVAETYIPIIGQPAYGHAEVSVGKSCGRPQIGECPFFVVAQHIQYQLGITSDSRSVHIAHKFCG